MTFNIVISLRALAVVDFRGPILAFVGFCGSVLPVEGFRRSALVFVAALASVGCRRPSCALVSTPVVQSIEFKKQN